ncbi:PhzF family phenazine biosynthesis protein [Dactylosporangium sp. McL0621]|uniref:PhzF family phenazine biosynthesis protein n=1 Tax=Dactylosporangium sp. McL0621 TaxID=3415678 RepID=UPI003CE89D87
MNACTRDGQGGSPTAVVIDNATLTDDDRHAIARTTGTSHTAFIDTGTADAPTVRFFTSAGELTNCGHGTIAAQAVLLHRSGATEHRGAPAHRRPRLRHDGHPPSRRRRSLVRPRRHRPG